MGPFLFAAHDGDLHHSTGMLRRDPSRLELKASDILDLDKAREEYLESVRIKTREAQLLMVTPGPPPPTPANRHELKAGVTGTGTGQTSNKGSSTAGGTGNGSGSGANNAPVVGSASTTTMLDPIEIAHLERKAKSTRERIGLGR